MKVLRSRGLWSWPDLVNRQIEMSLKMNRELLKFFQKESQDFFHKTTKIQKFSD